MSRTARSNNKLVGVVAAILLALSLGGAYALVGNDPKASTSNPIASSSEESKVVIEDEMIRYPGEEGKTVLDLLKNHTQVVTKDSSLGEYVVSINGNDGGGDKYWLFYVNDQQSSVGAAVYISQAIEMVEWRLE